MTQASAITRNNTKQAFLFLESRATSSDHDPVGEFKKQTQSAIALLKSFLASCWDANPLKLTHRFELEFRLNPKEVKEEKGSLA